MRIFLSILAFFSLAGTLRAQDAPEIPRSYGRSLPGCGLLPYPSEEAATAADGGDNRYFTRLAEWTHDGNVFSARFAVPFAWVNRQVEFHLDNATADYEIRINGRTAAYNADGNTPADFNITKYVREGHNEIEVVLSAPSPAAPLESWKKEAVPAIGAAWLASRPTLHVRDVVTKTWYGSDEDDTATAEIGIVMKSEALNPRTSRIHYQLLTPSGEPAAQGYEDITLGMRGEDTVRFLARIPSDLLWSDELPTQYILRLKTQHEGRYLEYMEARIGFRTVAFRDGVLSVNGRPAALRVYEVPSDLPRNTIAELRELGFNTLKFLPGPVSAETLDICDTQGMYVIVQAPVDTRNSGESRRKGGNPSNDPAWRPAYLERISNSYHTTKRHPSVIAFSLAGKSSNGINLYEGYLQMKRQDETRPFIYLDAEGEWNSDRFTMELTPAE